MVNTVGDRRGLRPAAAGPGHGRARRRRSPRPAPTATHRALSQAGGVAAHHDDGAGRPGRHGGDRRRARATPWRARPGRPRSPTPSTAATSPVRYRPPSPGSPRPRTPPCRPSWCSSGPTRSTAASWPPRCSPRSCGTRLHRYGIPTSPGRRDDRAARRCRCRFPSSRRPEDDHRHDAPRAPPPRRLRSSLPMGSSRKGRDRPGGSPTVRMDRLLEEVEVIEVHGDPAATEVTAIEFDSRRVEPGALFCLSSR